MGPAQLHRKIWAFFLGAVLGLSGIYLEMPWLLAGALVVLVGSMALRFLPVRDPDASEGEAEPGL
jgi:hypothetical protein